MGGTLLTIGECMVELKQADGGLLHKGYAGDTFNTAYYARACLPPDWTAAYASVVGQDRVSDDMLAFMAETGVDTRFIRRNAERTVGLYMIHLDRGERSFSYWRSHSAARTLADDADALGQAMDAADVVLFSGVTLAILPPEGVDTLLALAARAKASGKLVAFDPNIRPRLWADPQTMRDTISRGAQAASMVLPSFDDETTHFGDANIEATVTRYRTLGVRDIVVKNGAAGVTLDFDGDRRFVPAVMDAAIVDTTSAGDSFNGAFLAHYIQHQNAPEAAAYAARLAAAVIGHHGALVAIEKLGL